MAEADEEPTPDEQKPKDIEAEAAVDEATGESDLAIPQLILTAVSGWALKNTDTSTYYAFGAFALSISHAIFGTFIYAHVDAHDLDIYYYNSLITTISSVLPLINSELYLKSGFAPYLGYIFVATGLTPLLVAFIDDNYTIKTMHGVFIFNFAALIYFIANEQKGNWLYGIAAASMCSAVAVAFQETVDRYLTSAVALGVSCFNIAAVYCLAEQ